MRDPAPRFDAGSMGKYALAAFTGSILRRGRSRSSTTACRRARRLGNSAGSRRIARVTKQGGSRPPPATVDSAAARRASLRVIAPASAHPSPSCYNWSESSSTGGHSQAVRRSISESTGVPGAAGRFLPYRPGHPTLSEGYPGCLWATPRLMRGF